MRKRRAPKSIVVLNLILFSLFAACLWFFSFDRVTPAAYGIGFPEMEVLLLQAVSGLLLLGAIQVPAKTGKNWRTALLTLSFVALSESSLVALLTPVS